ncbi:MAG: GAF domain-containing protein [Acidobacteriota bacterium]
MGRGRIAGKGGVGRKKPTPARPKKPQPARFKIARAKKPAGQAAAAGGNREIDALERELYAARQQQIATADILKAISRSSFDLQALLETLTASAASLCKADMAAMTRRQADGRYYHVTNHNLPADWVEFQKSHPLEPSRGSVVGRVLLEKKPVQIADVLSDREYTYLEAARKGGYRTFLGVPLVREGEPIGVFTLGRKAVDPFTRDQIRLVSTFADQAVIAIENVRLLDALQARTSELSETLERQTATNEVLKAISRSGFDLQAILETVLENAIRLCGASRGHVFLYDGEFLRFVKASGSSPGFTEYLQANPFRPGKGSISGRAALERQICHVHDILQVSDYEHGELLRQHGFRTVLAVPMLRKGDLLGVIAILKSKVEPFTDRQVELIATFADQAVIAIENGRLLSELRESLEQQTATGDVLNVISRSTFRLQPVLDTIVEVASRLCEAEFAVIFKLQDGKYHAAAATNTAASFISHATEHPIEPVRGSLIGRTALEGKTVHLPDCLADPDYTFLDYQAVGKYRSMLGVPLLREGAPIGVIGLMRTVVRPFSEKQIELVTTFADQAVIAIENVRLFDELQARTHALTEALEQQTATSEVLSVISSSPGELEPVFAAMLRNAMRICDAKYGVMFEFADGAWRALSSLGIPPAFADYLHGQFRVWGAQTGLGRVADTKKTVHIEDVRAGLAYVERDPSRVAAVEMGGARTLLVAPMLKENELIGAVGVFRQEVRPFTEKQIELVTTFAKQAVIAIENVRLLNELRESLQQQTATADVLKVISRSAFDLQRVFETVAESAVRLCDADKAFIYRFDGQYLRAQVAINASQELREFIERNPMLPGRGNASARCALERRTVHIHDIMADPEITFGAKGLAEVRTILCAPMLKGDELLGVITVFHSEVRPFSETQIALIETFADQAAIAVENVRLLSELRESLQQQTATADVLKVISRSAFDLQRVYETVAESAVRLCEANRATIFRFDGEFLRHDYSFNASRELREFVERNPIRPGRYSGAARCALERRTIHIHDVMADPEYTYGAVAMDPIRTVLSVPMLKGDDLLGVIVIFHLEVRPFTDKQIALIETFADQAAIAIENVRLLNELRESLQQQTATADVLKVISRSTFDLQTVLQTLVESAARLCDADQGTMTRQQDGLFFRAASYGFSSEFTKVVTKLPVEVERGSATGRALAESRIVHIPDVQADPDYTFDEAKKLGGFRTILAVPMLREGVPTGVLALTRVEVRPFTDKQIELVSTFADQAAIAIENVRLFESVEARTRELSKSLEDLRTAQDRLVQTEKLASLGQLTAGIAHEIKNPLNFVNNFASLSTELIDELGESLQTANLSGAVRAEIEETAQMLRGNLEKIVQHGKRADSIVKNMLLHSRQGAGEHRPVDINGIVEESLNLAYHGARAEKQGFNITLQKSLDPAAGEIDLFPQEITRVLLNLISNGFYAATKRKALEGGNGFEPTLAAATRNLGDSVEIRIRDNGTGIPPEVREKIFNPFFTTKPAGEGTGLGLSLSYDIVVKQHAGSIAVETEPGKFTEFRIVLPRRAATIAETGAHA